MPCVTSWRIATRCGSPPPARSPATAKPFPKAPSPAPRADSGLAGGLVDKAATIAFLHWVAVPTIRRFAACKIAIYADDHMPPHFHIEGRGFRAIVEIETNDRPSG